MEWGDVGAGGAPLHRFAVPLALSGEASLICNLCDITCNKMAPLKGELGAKRSEGFSQKGTSSCVKSIPISRLDKGGTPGYNEDKRGHCYL